MASFIIIIIIIIIIKTFVDASLKEFQTPFNAVYFIYISRLLSCKKAHIM